MLLHVLCVSLSSHFAYLTVFGGSFLLAASSLFPSFLMTPGAKVVSVGCVGFLVGGTSACVLVDEAVSCLSDGQVRVWWCVLGCL